MTTETDRPAGRPGDLPAGEHPEEARLDEDIPQRILRHGGHSPAVTAFAEALDRAATAEDTTRTARKHGRALWRNAARRLRETDGDDRPLYWSRLAMARTLRERRGDVPEAMTALELASRGQEGNRLPAGEDRLRILVTGFDPFRLDEDLRRSNPSGAAVLAVHGTTLRTPSGRTAHIEGVIFPVRWADFTAGAVESALDPYLAPGPRQADLFLTLSQGRRGAFDLERYNGAWRGGGTDNTGATAGGPVPVPGGPHPAWTVSSLPYRELTAEAGVTGRFPVRDRTAVTEVPAGGTDPVERPDGPTDGSAARAGGGGDYLSNEIAYRATLLRDTLDERIPGGHLHTPALVFAEDNTDGITDRTLVADRQAITSQLRALLTRAAESLG
ncbi:pyroglutamyl peptidase [Streptomyces sp. ACA25]|uniref:pyroglutamyl peptidase n=1 Tax=Streptomyces sp. ACA25 TaxID=3022596 RepID=UPI002307BA9A|nr:pyroglutamyl peptidase [Streptomyces sp. ACA25]MDB1087735.1 pyroglutamyl peptidase [Streptomyces sp. ACA25]